MTLRGHIRNGTLVFDEPPALPEGAEVEVDLRAVHGDDSRPAREHNSGLDALDISARLAELRTLKDGWLEGKGKSPRPEGLDWLAGAFRLRFPDDSIPPHLYPTAEGGIQAEWSLKPCEISLEIDLTSHAAQWHGLNMQTGEEETRELNLDADDDWGWLAAQVKRAARGAA